MSNFELEFYDRLQYWHRLEEKVVRIMKNSVSPNCQGTWMTSAGLSVPVTPKPSLSVLA